MRYSIIKTALNFVTVTAVSATLLICIIILSQIRTQNDVIQEQTDINFRFFRCLVLIPPKENRTTGERIGLVDKCAADSKKKNIAPGEVIESEM